MSRGQEDFDAALRDALLIRSTYYDLMHLIDSWEHLRFTEANEYVTEAGRMLDSPQVRRYIDATVGSCITEHSSRLPNEPDPDCDGCRLDEDLRR